MEGITCEQTRKTLEDHMHEVGNTEGKGVIIDQEITVEVRSNGVPTIDLVDVPGLVASKANSQSPDMPELTEQCTLEYLKKESTGVVVCVMDASHDNMRASNAIKMVQQAPEPLRKNAIGVFAKADKAEDPHWEDEEDENGNIKNGPLWRLEERMVGTHKDYRNSNEPFPGVHRGFIAVVDRNTRSRAKKNQSLTDHNADENEWMESKIKFRSDNSEAADPRLLCCLGLDNLVLKIDSVISDHLGREWVPQKLEETASKRTELLHLCKQLGKNPREMSLDELCAAAEAKLKTSFPNEALEICEAKIEAMLPHPSANDGTLYDQVLKASEFEGLVLNFLRGHSFIGALKEKLRVAMRNCFDAHQEGDDIKLHRFDGLGDAFEMSLLQVMEQHQTTFVAAATRSAEHFFLCCHEVVDRCLDRDKLMDALLCRTVETLLLPLVGSPVVGQEQQTYIDLAFESFHEMPKEKCAAERGRYENSIEQLQKIEDCYRSIASSSQS